MSEQIAAPAVTTKAKKESDYKAWFGPNVLAGGLYHDGSVLANRLGLQLARVATLNTEWRLRKRAVDADLKPYVETFERDGVLVIENFLPPDVFAAIQVECRAAYDDGLFGSKVLVGGVTEGSLGVAKHKDRLSATWETLPSHDFLKRLSAALLRRPSIEKMKIEARVLTESKDAPLASRLIETNCLHADVHFPSMKAWLYLNDIDEENGAFVYAKASQKMTFARLAYEYDASIRVAKAKRDGTVYRTVSVEQVQLPTERQLKAMRIVESVMAGKANTIVFANIMGFHKRGEFAKGARREQIQIRFQDRPEVKKTKEVPLAGT